MSSNKPINKPKIETEPPSSLHCPRADERCESAVHSFVPVEKESLMMMMMMMMPLANV
jgi:hypothetical protein